MNAKLEIMEKVTPEELDYFSVGLDGSCEEVNDVIRCFHHLQVVLDDNQGMTGRQQRVEAIQQLNMYVAVEDIQPLLFAMEALKLEPKNEAHLKQMENAFNALGITQGAVLTYAPYIGLLLSDDPFDN